MHGPALNTCLRNVTADGSRPRLGIGIQWSKECCQQHTHPNVSGGRLATDWLRPMPPIEVGSGGLPRCQRMRRSLWKACYRHTAHPAPHWLSIVAVARRSAFCRDVPRSSANNPFNARRSSFHDAFWSSTNSVWCPPWLPIWLVLDGPALNIPFSGDARWRPPSYYSVLNGSQLFWHSASPLALGSYQSLSLSGCARHPS